MPVDFTNADHCLLEEDEEAFWIRFKDKTAAFHRFLGERVRTLKVQQSFLVHYSSEIFIRGIYTCHCIVQGCLSPAALEYRQVGEGGNQTND